MAPRNAGNCSRWLFFVQSRTGCATFGMPSFVAQAVRLLGCPSFVAQAVRLLGCPSFVAQAVRLLAETDTPNRRLASGKRCSARNRRCPEGLAQVVRQALEDALPPTRLSCRSQIKRPTSQYSWISSRLTESIAVACACWTAPFQ